MKRHQLESALSAIKQHEFSSPKIQYEQYPTSAHLASCMLFTAQNTFNDIDGKDVLDLGCGTGMLSIGSALLGANYVLSVDVDDDALKDAQENKEDFEMDEEEDDDEDSKMPIEFLKLDISSPNAIQKILEKLSVHGSHTSKGGSEAAVSSSQTTTAEEEATNAVASMSLSSKSVSSEKSIKKFNTVVMNPPFGTRTKGIDMLFVQVGLACCDTAVYSLHKTSTREFIIKKATKVWGVECEVIAEMKFDIDKSYKFHTKESKDIEVDLIRFSHKP